MLVNSINAMSGSVVNNSRSIQKNKIKNVSVRNDQPTFKSAAYKAAFAKCFNGSMKRASNEQIYRELMGAAQRAQGAVVDDIAKVFIKPDEYNIVMNGFRQKRAVYSDLNNASFERPLQLVGKGGSTLVSVVNFGHQGGFWEVLSGRGTQDTRICFHGIEELKDCIICLGKDNAGNDIRHTASNGIRNLIASEMTKTW